MTTKTDWEKFLDTLIAEVRMWALNHEGNIGKIHPIYTEAKQAIEALLSHQREELLDQVEREVMIALERDAIVEEGLSWENYETAKEKIHSKLTALREKEGK